VAAVHGARSQGRRRARRNCCRPSAVGTECSVAKVTTAAKSQAPERGAQSGRRGERPPPRSAAIPSIRQAHQAARAAARCAPTGGLADEAQTATYIELAGTLVAVIETKAMKLWRPSLRAEEAGP
jgi:hypothetical protein